ncbi:MAG: hypothetical protein GY801_35935 [bacterium]|nr:hypothetical protein [bacterium]
MRKLSISAAGLSLSAGLYETPTARSIWDALPFEGKANTWGDEIYFPISLRLEQEDDARAELEVGELGYWKPGQMFCIFFGPTPSSVDEQPRAASPVNVFGRVTGDSSLLRSLRDGELLSISQG